MAAIEFTLFIPPEDPAMVPAHVFKIITKKGKQSKQFFFF
jgi:hypothetical protein